LQPPLCAVRAGQNNKSGILYWRRKINKQEKSSEKGVRICKPLYLPSAQDKRKIKYSILVKEKRKKQARNKEGIWGHVYPHIPHPTPILIGYRCKRLGLLRCCTQRIISIIIEENSLTYIRHSIRVG